MTEKHSHNKMNRILAVIVMYRLAPAASASYVALSHRLQTDSTFRDMVELLVMDNSPGAQSLPAGSAGTYSWDGSNPGLARRYNDALEAATRAGATWLLLLDQDTTLTPEYLDELKTLSQRFADQQNVVAIVPKLVCGNQVYSPHGPCYRGPLPSPRLDTYGIFEGLIRPFNSGATLRVKTLQDIGGFPEAYWLDYLDHATFHRLQEGGGDVFIMHARLEHDMSFHRLDKHLDPGNAARHSNQLDAMVRFYNEHGSASERTRLRLDLLRDALRSLAQKHLAEAGRYLRAAVHYPAGLSK